MKTKEKEEITIMGIDVGLAILGWSILKYSPKTERQPELVQFGVITTEKNIEIEDRLYKIYKDLNTIIDEYKPEEVAIESLFYFKNQKTVMNVSQVRGVIILVSRMSNLDIFNYTPLQVKTSVTGYGRAEKLQIQKMVKAIFKLDELPKPDDAADAVAIALTHVNMNKYIGSQHS